MFRLFKTTFLFGIIFLLVSCAFDIDNKGGIKGNGTIQKENRKVTSAFETIVASEDLKVLVSEADEFRIIVEADENIIELIESDIIEKTLHLHTSRNIGRATKRIYVYLPKVFGLRSSKGAVMQTQNRIKGDSLVLEASSGSILKAEFWYKNVMINGKEGSNLKLTGASNNVIIDVSAGSTIDADEFEATKCSIKASYGGNVKIQILTSLSADANTGGTITYIGNPKVDKTKSLTGNVQKD